MSELGRPFREVRLCVDMLRPNLPYRIATVEDVAEIERCRQFVTERNLRSGVVMPECVVDGVMTPNADPYHQRAKYFGVYEDGADGLCATARLIRGDDCLGWESFQLHWEDIDGEFLERFRSDHPEVSSCAEMSAYMKSPDAPSIAPVALIRHMLLYSLQNGIDAWVFGLNSKVVPTYEQRFGGALVRMGDDVRLGELQASYVPFVLDIGEACERFAGQRRGGLARSLADRALQRFMNDVVVAARTRPGATV